MSNFPINALFGETEKLPVLSNPESSAKKLEDFLAERDYVLKQVLIAQDVRFYVFLKIDFETNIRPEGEIEQTVTPSIVVFTTTPSGCSVTVSGQSKRVNGILAKFASGSIVAYD